MAEEKKNFIFYTSWKTWLDAMTLEQKGMWLDWVMTYCDDKEPPLPEDAVVKMGCLIAKENLKRDLVKYQLKVESIKSAREKKKQQESNSNQDDINMKSSSNQTDIKSVNVNVNDNVNVNVNVKDNGEDKSSLNINYICIEIPLNDGTLGKITEDEFNLWTKTYPAIDVENELNRMICWLNANPKNRKTKGGYKRFINTWLSKAQDQARRIPNQTPENSSQISSAIIDDEGLEFIRNMEI